MFNKATTMPKLPIPAIAVRGAVVLGGLLGLYAIYSIVWMAVSAALGIAVIGAIVLGCFAVLSMLPMLGQYLENWILKMRKSAARANPVEQLQNYKLMKVKQIGALKEEAKTMLTSIREMEQVVSDRQKLKKDVSRNVSDVGALKKLYSAKIEKIQRYDEGLRMLDDQIADTALQQRLAKSHAAALAASGSAVDEVTENMLAQEAIAASNANLNAIFAELEVDAATLNETKHLEYSPGKTIDLTAVTAPILVPARS